MTDGGISKKHAIEIAIHKNDEHILKQLEQDLQIQNHIHPFGTDYVRFSLTSVNMCDDLIQYGLVPNKTLDLQSVTIMLC